MGRKNCIFYRNQAEGRASRIIREVSRCHEHKLALEGDHRQLPDSIK